MINKHHKLSAKAGLPPGTIVFIGKREINAARIDLIEYDPGRLNEQRDVSVDRCAESVQASGVTWINVNGMHDVGLIESLGKLLDLHPLTLEDIVNTSQRPKTEEFPEYI